MSHASKAPAAGSLRFSVLGTFGAELDGQALPLGPRLQRTLLAILVLEAGHIVPVDRLIGLLWHDEPPGAAIASLQAYVSQLRRLLEPGRPARAPSAVLATQDPGYVLRATQDQIDALRFQALARQAHLDLAGGDPAAAAARAEAALALWQGEPLAEFAGEPWAVPVAARLTEARDIALEDRADAWLELGQHTRAAAELEDMVAARPLRERRWAQLMLASYRSGRQADALRAYQRCRAVLGDELGVEPGPQLRRLETAVLAQDPSLDWRPPSSSAQPVPPPAPDNAAALTGLIGRAAEVARLEARLRQAAAGSGGTVVLIGEPGAGKTTMAEAVARLAAEAGFVTAWGRCLDAASAPAYWPWSQVLRSLAPGPLVSAAAARLNGEAGAGDADCARQFRAYQALSAALAEAAGSAAAGSPAPGASPLLAVIDDLHAADEESLGLLQLLAGDLHRMPVLLLFTVRDTENSRPLALSLGEALRHPGAERLALSGFTASDVAILLEHLTGEPPQADAVAAIIERTGGNPFYTTELVRLISSEHRHRPLTAGDVLALDVPGGIRDVLARRVHRLPEDTQSLLTVAAVAGRDLVPELLEHVTGLDAEELLRNLEPAVAAGLVTATGTGWGFRFRHPLIQESLRASAGHLERARLHARVAAVLEELSGGQAPADRLAQLAYHYLSAGPFGDPAKAVSYARQAARHAVRQGAWHDAIRHLVQALAAISPNQPRPDAIRCDVLLELGRAYRAASKIGEAHACFKEAISLADRGDDADRRLAAAVAFGRPALWGSRAWGETDQQLIGQLERELGAVAPDDPRRVRILSTLAMELYDAAIDRGWTLALESLDAAKALDRADELSLAVSACLHIALGADHLPERRAILEQALAGQLGELTPLVTALLHATMLTERIRFAELARFDAEFPAAWRLAAELRTPELQAQLRFVQASRYFAAGDVELGSGSAARGFETMTNITVTWLQPARFALDSAVMLLTGTLAEHAAELAASLAKPDHPSLPHLIAPAAALGFAQAGDLVRTVELAERWFVPPPRSWSRPQAIAYWAQVAAAVGVPDPSWLYEQLLPHSGELAIAGAGVDCGGAVDSLLAGLALRLGRPAEAAERARSGLALEQRTGSPVWTRRTTEFMRQLGAPV
jgi:DNA-binding SARP family transcriptional activator